MAHIWFRFHARRRVARISLLPILSNPLTSTRYNDYLQLSPKSEWYVETNNGDPRSLLHLHCVMCESSGTYLMSDILAIVGDIIQRMRWDFGWRFADTCRHLKAPWRHLEGSLRTLADTLKTPWRHLLINAKVGRRLQPPHHGCLQGSPKGWIEHSNGDSAWDMSRTVTWTWHRSTRQIITDDHLIVV